MRGYRRATAALMVGALALAACGGDDDGASDDGASDDGGSGESQASEDYLDALTRSIMDDAEDEPLTSDESEARCAAEEITAAVPQSRLEELGVTIEVLAAEDPLSDGVDFTDDEATAVVDAIFECIDVGRTMAGAVAQDGALAEDDAACISEGFADNAAFRAFLATSLQEGDDAEPDIDTARTMAEVMIGCISFGEVFAESGGADLTDDEIACIDEALRDDDAVVDLLARELSGTEEPGDESGAAFFDAMSGCVDPSKLLGSEGG